MEVIEKNLPQKKQTFEDILQGEEPTEEYIEEFNAINNSSISDADIERQAMVFKPEEPLDSIVKEPSYKTSEMNLISWLMIILLMALVLEIYSRFLSKS